MLKQQKENKNITFTSVSLDDRFNVDLDFSFLLLDFESMDAFKK
jgi:hypothetical protein